MIENIKYKVADVAKDLKLPVKDVWGVKQVWLIT